MQRGEVPNGRKDDSVPSCKGLDPIAHSGSQAGTRAQKRCTTAIAC